MADADEPSLRLMRREALSSSGAEDKPAPRKRRRRLTVAERRSHYELAARRVLEKLDSIDALALATPIGTEASSSQMRIQIEEFRKARDEAQAALQELVRAPKVQAKRKPTRRVNERDNFPRDRTRFVRWLHTSWAVLAPHQDADAFIENIARSAQIDANRLLSLMLRVGKEKELGAHQSTLSGDEIDSCIDVCVKDYLYFEPGLATENEIVKFLFLFLEENSISNDKISRLTNVPLKTVESWNSKNNQKRPRLADIIACLEEFGVTLVPSVSSTAKNDFKQELVRLETKHAKSIIRSKSLRQPVPIKRS